MNKTRTVRIAAGLVLGIGLGATLSNVTLGIAFSRIDGGES